MDPYYSYRSGAGSASASSGYGGYSSSYRLQPQYSQPRDSYALDRWSSLPLPSADLPPYSAFPRSSLDPRLDRVASFPREVAPRGYGRPLPEFRPRRRAGDARPLKKKPVAVPSLGPKKKAFKQTQAVKVAQKTVPKKEVTVEVKEGKDKSNAAAMAKEIKELHSLWRTGVDVNPAKKQKIEEEKKGGPKGKKGGGKTSDEDLKKGKRKRKRGPAKQKKKWVKKDGKFAEDGTAEDGKIPLSEEEKQAIIDLQREAGKSAREFLGVPPDGEPTDTEAPPEAAVDGEPEQKTEEKTVEKTLEKTVELTLEEAKANEEKAVEYFSKMFEENQELRKLYVENCNDGTFECVVCSAIGVRYVKRFRNLVSLAMHASKIQKPKLLHEHRGYGRAVCSVLGWDPLKLPPLPRGKGLRPRGATTEGEDTQAKKDSDMSEAAAEAKVENGDDLDVPDKDTEEAPEEIEADEDDEKTEKDSSANEAADEA